MARKYTHQRIHLLVHRAIRRLARKFKWTQMEVVRFLVQAAEEIVSVRDEAGWFIWYQGERPFGVLNALNADAAVSAVRQMLLGHKLDGEISVKAFSEVDLETVVRVGLVSILQMLTGGAVKFGHTGKGRVS